ncbi:MAG: hypothetical protein HND27_00785 [Bacteroidetes bacterium]|nr:hypothetical protein [Bacteroidota bacterium]MBV6461997.1 hypothetical protein [Flavobacteriales bacterium]WKZ76608.1 MAG: hypothetical protein QY303_06825 [Vicingaceae bacterium]MCL4815571.1 hypothetical protein [Flavobacteriales bacterium]NOG94291.1 hypothetical protein [Bacteroidota bacterium]
MHIPSIKKLIETYDLPQLQEAEVALLEEGKPEIIIEGADEGEQLTHVMAAIWIKNEMNEKSIPFVNALREYTQRVRNSIS